MNVDGAHAYLKRTGRTFQHGSQEFLAPSMMRISDDVAVPARYFSDDVVVLYLVEDNDRFTYVQERDMSDAGIDDDELHNIGVANLAKLLPSMSINNVDGMLMFSGSGNFEASFLLLPGLWQSEIAAYFPNGPVAAIAARDILCVCDRDDADAVERLRQSVGDTWARSTDHLLTRELYALDDDGAWTQFGAAPIVIDATDAAQLAESAAPINDLGIEEITISENDFNEPLTDEQLKMMLASGYRFDAMTRTFQRRSAGVPGAPERPWLDPNWHHKSKRRRGILRR